MKRQHKWRLAFKKIILVFFKIKYGFILFFSSIMATGTRSLPISVVVLVLCVLFASVARLNAMFDCAQVTVDSIAPNTPDFSDNACIIIADFTVPDCSIPPPDPFAPDAPLIMCPNAPVTPTMVVDGSQVVYNDLAYALQTCPFDPVLIGFI